MNHSLRWLVFLAALLIVGSVSAQQIDQERGVDQRVDYPSLVQYGPWDDRNYDLTKEDIDLLPKGDQYLGSVPVFYKIEYRKRHPELGIDYPRSLLQGFQHAYGGLLQDGVLKRQGLGLKYVPPNAKDLTLLPKSGGGPVTVLNENPLNSAVAGNETAVEFSPVDPNRAISGSNTSGGQEMYFTSDGGQTWTSAGTLFSSCCDPTVDWSSDGLVAYASTLEFTAPGVIGITAYRSTDFGATWTNRVQLTTAGSDKEYIHVDRAAASPFTDNVYLTWHDGNVMQFSRSTDRGLTWSTPLGFPGETTGIGSDITTDESGIVYYFYPSLTFPGDIILLRSLDGGVTFEAGRQVADLNGRFDFPIPAMETREAFIYVSADTDMSGGTFDGRVYASWTDETDSSNGTADAPLADNHGRIVVAFSDDQGLTWTIAAPPHETADDLTVDRFHQWLKVDENGGVHIIFYDTRNSGDRTGVDLYYAFSADGAASWTAPQRITSVTSPNIADGQEWGDYNGLSVILDQLITTWTDNRPAFGKVAAASLGALGPGFSLSGTPDMQNVCAGNALAATTIDVASIMSFSEDVTLSLPGLDAGVFDNATFTVNPVTPGNSSVLNVDVLGAAPTGMHTITVQGDSAPTVITSDTTLMINVSNGIPGVPTLTSPSNGAVDQPLPPTLTWGAVAGATDYTVELADDAGFSNIIFTDTVTDTMVVPGVGLDRSTEYFWRVTANNPCGTGTASGAFSFTTTDMFCVTPNAAIPDNDIAGLDSTIVVGDVGLLADLNVSIMADHTFVGDLIFTLTNVDTATSVTLMDRPGVPATGFGCGADNVDVVFDDASGTPVEDVCNAAPAAAIGGTLMPEEALSAFNNQPFASTWTLNVSDNAGADTGTLDEWCLIQTIRPGTGPDAIFSSSFEPFEVPMP